MELEGIKGKVGAGQAELDMAADPMNYCINHPYKNNNNNNGGGICAFCLQEKLSNLVSSSTPLHLRASSSPSPPDAGLAAVGGGFTSLSMSGDRHTTEDDHNVINNNNGTSHYQEYLTRRSRNHIPLPKKKIMAPSSSTTTTTSDHHHHHYHDGIVLKRSKSTAITPRARRSAGRFWSFLYLSSKTQNAKKTDNIASIMNHHHEDDDDEDDVRKVSRSRSVSCGSRSFSGDLFGDCTLRRVESQREPKPKPKPTTMSSGGIKNSTTWGWTFASPIRAFSSKKDKINSNTTTTPNLSATPSLLAT